MTNLAKAPVTVWDLPTRLCHWAIALMLLFQWFSIAVMDDWMTYHELGGYVLLTLILFRICWGFVGTVYARFSEFLYSPKQTYAYLKTLHQPDSEPFAGHNPMGGLAVMLLLSLLLLQAVSGLFMTDDILFYGPYYSAVNDETQKLMSRLHHLTFDALLWFVGVHVVTVVFYELYKKQRLVRAMFTGEKHDVCGVSIIHHRLVRAVVVLAVCIAGTYGLVALWAPETINYY